MNAKRKVQFEECDISGDRGAPLLPVIHKPLFFKKMQDFGAGGLIGIILALGGSLWLLACSICLTCGE